MKYTLPELRKTLVSVVGFLLTVIAACLTVGGIIPVEALPYVYAFIGVASSYGVFAARNARPDELAEHRA